MENMEENSEKIGKIWKTKNSHCSKIYCVLQLFEIGIGQGFQVIRNKH
jgi:hypothetical protein